MNTCRRHNTPHGASSKAFPTIQQLTSPENKRLIEKGSQRCKNSKMSANMELVSRYPLQLN